MFLFPHQVSGSPWQRSSSSAFNAMGSGASAHCGVEPLGHEPPRQAQSMKLRSTGNKVRSMPTCHRPPRKDVASRDSYMHKLDKVEVQMLAFYFNKPCKKIVATHCPKPCQKHVPWAVYAAKEPQARKRHTPTEANWLSLGL